MMINIGVLGVFIATSLVTSCSSENGSVQGDPKILLETNLDKRTRDHSAFLLQQLKKSRFHIKELIDGSSCTGNDECTAAPIGLKPCGGPASYVYFSNKMEKLGELQTELSTYNSLSSSYNSISGSASNCSVLTPPEKLICNDDKKCVE